MLEARLLSLLYPHQPHSSDAYGVDITESINDACEWYRRSLYKQLVNREVDNDVRLRPSMLGKAAVDILTTKFMPELYRDTISDDRFWQLLHDGDTFESDYRVHLALRGIPVVASQVQCDWNGIKGNADIVVTIGNKKVLLELKTANSGFYSSITKMQSIEDRQFYFGNEYQQEEHLFTKYSNFRGHITQAAIYGSALDCDESVIVLKNKETSEVGLYSLTNNDKEGQLKRVKNIVECYDYCEEFWQIFTVVGIPDPKKELRQKNHTGRYLVNPKLYGSPIIPLVYEWGIDKDKIIVEGYRVHENALKEIPPMLLETYQEISLSTYTDDDIPYLLEEWNEYQRIRKQK